MTLIGERARTRDHYTAAVHRIIGLKSDANYVYTCDDVETIRLANRFTPRFVLLDVGRRSLPRENDRRDGGATRGNLTTIFFTK